MLSMGRNQSGLKITAALIPTPRRFPSSRTPLIHLSSTTRFLTGTLKKNILSTFFYPKDSDHNEDSIHSLPMFSNAKQKGTFSSGSLKTADEDAYYLKIQVSQDASVIIDNFRLYRSDTVPTTSESDKFSALAEMSFPRLGNNIGGEIKGWVKSDYTVPDWPDEYVYKAEEVEEKLAFFDTIEDIQYKGYLGMPLSDAQELKSPSTLIGRRTSIQNLYLRGLRLIQAYLLRAAG